MKAFAAITLAVAVSAANLNQMKGEKKEDAVKNDFHMLVASALTLLPMAVEDAT